MFAPKVVKAQTNALEGQTNKLAPQPSTLVARPFGGGAAEQAHILQRSIGNQPTLRLLSQRASSQTGKGVDDDSEQEAAPENMTARATARGVSWDFSKIPIFPPDRPNQPQALFSFTARPLPGPVQAKLVVGPVDDPLEHEADRAAGQVMSTLDRVQRACCSGCASGGSCEKELVTPASEMAKAPLGGACPSTPAEQPEEGQQLPEKQEQSAVQGKAAAGGLHHRGHFEAGLAASAGDGVPLSDRTRRGMESGFGWDFGGVRVHAEERAAAQARSINALAFTTGRDIYFASGRYDPDSAAGSWLLAHELSHVVQQGSTRGRIMRYSLDKFPAAEATRMNAAIPEAQSTVSNCQYLKPKLRKGIRDSIGSASYKYDAKEKNCGVAYGGFLGIGRHITIGPAAFDMKQCCFLSSTIAHENGHLKGLDEPKARALECNCAGCCPNAD